MKQDFMNVKAYVFSPAIHSILSFLTPSNVCWTNSNEHPFYISTVWEVSERETPCVKSERQKDGVNRVINALIEAGPGNQSGECQRRFPERVMLGPAL